MPGNIHHFFLERTVVEWLLCHDVTIGLMQCDEPFPGGQGIIDRSHPWHRMGFGAGVKCQMHPNRRNGWSTDSYETRDLRGPGSRAPAMVHLE